VSGPLPPALLPITIPLSLLYRGAMAARNAFYDRGMGITCLPVPVISIGNLSTGGTGKTPLTAWAYRALRRMGHVPVIAMRGHGARPGEGADEQAEYAERLPEAAIVARPNRAAALREVLPATGGGVSGGTGREWPAIDCVLLDDGFQHRRLARDLNIVLIDAERDTFRDRLLPAGHLREPLTNLRRADAVIVTRAEVVDPALEVTIAQYHGRPPLGWCRHDWAALDVHTRTTERKEVAWLRGKRLVIVLGVGHPASIERRLGREGAVTAARFIMADHHRYTPRDVERLRAASAGAEALFTTMKDWMKLRWLIDAVAWPVPIVVPDLRLEVHAGAVALEARLREAARATLPR